MEKMPKFFKCHSHVIIHRDADYKSKNYEGWKGGLTAFLDKRMYGVFRWNDHPDLYITRDEKVTNRVIDLHFKQKGA
jgi:hypothetical protein